MPGTVTQISWGDAAIRASRLGTVLDHGDETDIERLVDLVIPGENDVVLDMVTGLGHVARALALTSKKVTALDPDPEILREAEALTREELRDRIEWIVGDPLETPFKDKTCDVVSARMALRHMGDGKDFIREVHRILKPSGRFVMIDSLAPPHLHLQGFLGNLLSHNDRSHVKSYTLAELELLLEHEKFDIDLIEIYPKENDFRTWASKLGEDADNTRMIEKVLQGASTHARRHFRIIEKNKKVVSFITWMVLIRAKPSLL